MTIGSQMDEAGLQVEQICRPYPNLWRLLRAVISVWPEHSKYIAKSFVVRPPSLLSTSNDLAAAIAELAGSNEIEHIEDYKWLCEQIREEELHFARSGIYRYSTFAETNENVYSNPEFMKRYMNGLLISQVTWYMHASSLHYFSQRLSSRFGGGGSVLEVGSGHGLLLFLALRDLKMAKAVAWDLSAVSLDQTRAALGKLGALDRARFVVQDMHAVEPSTEEFDLVILSHLLEHLERPVDALARIRSVVSKTGLIYVNVPLNAPMPDHLILLSSPGEAEELLVEGGFRIVEMATHTTQAMSLSRSLRTKTAVTCSIIAELA